MTSFTREWSKDDIMESTSYGKLYYIKKIVGNRVSLYRVHRTKCSMITGGKLEYKEFPDHFVELMKVDYLLFVDNETKLWTVLKQEPKGKKK